MRTERKPEAQFRVSFTVTEKRLGATLRLINGAEGLSVNLIEERDPEHNLPRGAFRDTLKGLLKDGPVVRSVLLNQVAEMGFARTTFHSTITQLKKSGQIKLISKNGDKLVALTRKAV